MLQKKKLTTSTTRFASLIKYFDFYKQSHNHYLQKKKKYKNSKKIFCNTKNYNISLSSGINFAGVINNYIYNKKPYQALLTVKSIYNNIIIIPGIENLTPGRKFFNLTKELVFKKPFYTGSQIYLEDLPYNLFVSYISNNYNNKWTFAKSSGSFVTKLKAKKTVKLILVELPSKIAYLFLKKTKCFIGKNTNFFNNKFIEGKWGFSLHKQKSINVRGVAMNPVDHPNGGRTKAKQPEKSPWGWIAKQKK